MRLTDRMRRTPPTPRTLQASPRCGATWTCTPHSITAHLRMQTRDSQDCSAARTIRETQRRTAHRHHVRRPIVGGAHHESTASSLTSLTLALCATRALHDHCRTMRRVGLLREARRGLPAIYDPLQHRAHTTCTPPPPTPSSPPDRPSSPSPGAPHHPAAL